MDERDVAFPRLLPAEIESLRPWMRSRRTTEGDILIAAGERNFCFYVVVEGAVAIVEHSSGQERTVTVHEPGEFTGDVDMLTGRAALITARVARAGEVLEMSAEKLREAVKELAELGEKILKAFLMRRVLLLSGGFVGLRIIGSRFSPEAHQLRDFATRNAIPFRWIDVERDEQAETLLRQFGVTVEQTPVLITHDGRLLTNPTVGNLAHALGLDASLDPEQVYDLVVVGAGPAGLAASVYAASEGLTTLTLDSIAAGGQAGTSSRIENYLGFPAGITGAELTTNALLQAQRFGAVVTVPANVVGLRLDGGRCVVALEDGKEVAARCVLVASGVEYRRLDVAGFARYEGAGVYYAATDMEARLCRGDEVVVVGGGNSAGQATLYLSRFASRVYLVIRGDDLGKSMSRYLVDRVEKNPKVVIHRRSEVKALEGTDHLAVVHLTTDGREEKLITGALFMFIGATARTSWLRGCVHLDRNGFVLTGTSLPADGVANDTWRMLGRSPYFLETSLPGVFAAGDVRSGSVKRVSSAVGDGAMAVSFVHAHIAPPA